MKRLIKPFKQWLCNLASDTDRWDMVQFEIYPAELEASNIYLMLLLGITASPSLH